MIVELLTGNDSAQELPKVVIEFSAFQKMLCFTDLFPYEISGLGKVRQEENVSIIEDVFLVQQKSTRGSLHVEFAPRAFNELIAKMIASGENPSRLKFQWHSHANHGVFFSGEDKETIRGYLNDFMISLVVNKRHETCCRIDIFKPVPVSLSVPLYVRMPKPSEEVLWECKKQISENVTIEGKVLLGSKSGLCADIPMPENPSFSGEEGEIIVPQDKFFDPPQASDKP